MLHDEFNRRFKYLRLSLTSLCNFRCSYCLPNGNVFTPGCKDPLNFLEVVNLAKAFCELGVEKFRLTGGEPALREDLVPIIETLSAMAGVNEVALTTNGFRLTEDAQKYHDAGVTSLNVSIDSLDPKNFLKLTGKNSLPEILEGLNRCFEWDDWNVKVNAVLMKGKNDHEIPSFVEWLRKTPVSLRLIEIMPTTDNPHLFKNHYFDLSQLRNELIGQGWTSEERSQTAGPAEVYGHPDYLGKIGYIRPYSTNFCDGCNRLRVTSQGELRLCLFGESNYSLRSLCQRADQKEELKDKIIALLTRKESAHRLDEGIYEGTRNFAAIGG